MMIGTDRRPTEYPTAEMVEDMLAVLIQTEQLTVPAEDGQEIQVSRVRGFAEAGLMTRDNGLVLTFSDGSEFQLTIVRSR